MKKKVLALSLAFVCTYAAAQMGAAVFLGVQTSAANCTWSNAAVVSNGMALCPLNVGTSTAPSPGLAIALNQGSFVQVFPAAATAAGVSTFAGRTGAVVPALGDYSFNQLSGTVTASQMPSTMTCNVSATINTSNTVTLTACK